MTIKEFAALSGVESTTLRYWDEIGLFSPTNRNPENGYRYYSPAQLIPLNFVTALSDLDFSLKTIIDLENDRDPDKFISLIGAQEMLINNEMNRLRVCYAIIHSRRELISYGLRADETKVSILHRDNKPIILGPHNVYKDGETFVDALAALVGHSKERHMNLSFPIGGYYESLDSFAKAPKQPEHFFTIDPVGNSNRESGEYLVGFARGYYGEMGDLPERMIAYAEEHALNLSGPVYIMYLHDEICIKDPDRYLAQACIAVSR